MDAPAQNPSAPRTLAALLTAAFAAWQRAGLPFVVLRNYENLPASTTNDIDILIAPRHKQEAEALLIRAAASAGWRLHNRAQFSPVSLFFYESATLQQIQIDLFFSLKWRGFDMLSANEVLAEHRPRGEFAIPSARHEAVLNLLARLLYAGVAREKYRAGVRQTFRESSAPVTSVLLTRFGSRWADWLVQAVLAERWADIEAAAAQLRRALAFRQLIRNPLLPLGTLIADAVRLTGRWLRPPGLFVVLNGPDGCGKSTIAQALPAALRNSFNPGKGRHIHWKPRVLFQPRGTAVAAMQPHAAPARSVPVSIAYFLAHWLEFFLGAWLQIRFRLFVNGMVVAERYYLDFFVDPRRYRLNAPSWLVRAGWRLLPKPNLVLLLDAPPATLSARKQELPPGEVERQRAAFLDLAQRLPNARVLDATQPVEKVIADATRAILDYLAVRAGTAESSWTDLFGDRTTDSVALTWRVLRRHSHDWLMLPANRHAARCALSLYPAQRPVARALRGATAALLQAGLPLPAPCRTLWIPRDDKFLHFLRSLAPPTGDPSLAILAGNPAAPGRRFIVLVFDAAARPVAVVKAGTSGAAQRLIQAEADFLLSVPADTPGVPALRDQLESPHVRALALEYIGGDSPAAGDEAGVAALLTSWLRADQNVPLAQLAGGALLWSVGDRQVHPALAHGDFAPWNVKVTGAGWVALDWENGAVNGVPGWDWFHWVTQVGLLVERLDAGGLARRLEELLASARFREYAARAGIAGIERELVRGYLEQRQAADEPAALAVLRRRFSGKPGGGAGG